MFCRKSVLFIALAALSGLFTDCAPQQDLLDLMDIGPLMGAKADFAELNNLELDSIAAQQKKPITFTASGPFKVSLKQLGTTATVRLILEDGTLREETPSSKTPSITWQPETDGQPSYTLTIGNRSYSQPLQAALTIVALSAPQAEPTFEVLFTSPVCPEFPGFAPANVRCDRDDRDASRAASGISDKLKLWIDETREYKEAHPDQEVKITMAFLNWSNYFVYDNLCAAVQAGVKFEGFYDEGNSAPDKQQEKLSRDEACAPQNVTVHYAGGHTDYESGWRLMHVKMMIFDTGADTTRIVFGSANLSSYGDSINFENWVFSEFSSASHFVQAHLCGVEALRADAYGEDGIFPRVFEETYEECLSGLTVTEDTRYKVYFNPNSSKGALYDLKDAMKNATTSVDMAIQHFSNQSLASQLRSNGKDVNITTRLVLDDNTYYNGGETGGVDYTTYKSKLCYLSSSSAEEGDPCDVGIDIRFIQSGGYQYQHNKYVIIDEQKVFCGAGNFTSVAFGSTFYENNWRANYENFYFIDSPAFAAQYLAHFERLHGELGRTAEELPESSEF